MNKAEQAQYDLLKMATVDGKFALQLGAGFADARQQALEAMQLSGWVKLIDLTPVAEYPNQLFRVFLATPEAMSWFWSKS